MSEGDARILTTFKDCKTPANASLFEAMKFPHVAIFYLTQSDGSPAALRSGPNALPAEFTDEMFLLSAVPGVQDSGGPTMFDINGLDDALDGSSMSDAALPERYGLLEFVEKPPAAITARFEQAEGSAMGLEGRVASIEIIAITVVRDHPILIKQTIINPGMMGFAGAWMTTSQIVSALHGANAK